MGAPDPPPSLLPLLDGLEWHRDTVGDAGCSIWRFDRAAVPALFLKHAGPDHLADLTDEYARLMWLRPHLPVPEVRGFVHSDGEAWLLTEALPGEMAETLFEGAPDQRVAVTRRLARFLRRMHALPAAECPFSARLPLRLAAARRNIQAGRVNEEDFDEERIGMSAEQVLGELNALLPLSLEEVITHGDFSLGNVLIKDGEISGCIDVGRAGVADPYQDLAILWNCLREYDPDLQQELWRGYGLEEPDTRRIHLHLMLDELF